MAHFTCSLCSPTLSLVGQAQQSRLVPARGELWPHRLCSCQAPGKIYFPIGSRSRPRSAGLNCKRRPVRGPCCIRAQADAEVGAAPTAFAVSGLVASPIVLASCWALKTTGEGLPPGPGGIFGEMFFLAQSIEGQLLLFNVSYWISSMQAALSFSNDARFRS